jgi:hypothetical protein
MRALRLLPLLLGVACGGRSDVQLLTEAAPSAGGTNGRAASPTWDRVTWDPPLSATVVYLWSGGPSDAWAVMSESGGFVRAHWDGTDWTKTDGRFDNRQVWEAPSRVAFGGTQRGLQRFSAGSWRDWENTPACKALGGTTEADIWCATPDLWHFDGAEWAPSGPGGTQGILARTPTDVWAWGVDGAWHFDGVSWTATLSGLVRTVSASSASEVWAVQDGDVLHRTAIPGAWSQQNPSGASISGVLTQAPNNVWIVAAGAVMRFDGKSWATLNLPARDEWLLIAGSREDVWIAGTMTLLHGHAAGK